MSSESIRFCNMCCGVDFVVVVFFFQLMEKYLIVVSVTFLVGCCAL